MEGSRNRTQIRASECLSNNDGTACTVVSNVHVISPMKCCRSANFSCIGRISDGLEHVNTNYFLNYVIINDNS